MRRRLFALSLVCTLAGCVTQPAPSAYDLYADRFGPNGRTSCERQAYETGRQRFEFQSSFSGLAWAAHNANLAAEVAFERCSAGRGGRLALRT